MVDYAQLTDGIITVIWAWVYAMTAYSFLYSLVALFTFLCIMVSIGFTFWVIILVIRCVVNSEKPQRPKR